jgi:flagellar biosynthesis/type III secretory pathway protein FliH
MTPPTDPYTVLGIARAATDAEVRTAYRRAVQRTHPDHNGGSPDAARRFEEVQEAYAEIRRRRSAGSDRPPPPPPAGPAPPSDPDLDARLAAMERELREARDARERVVQAAREAAQAAAQAARAAASGHGTGRTAGRGQGQGQDQGPGRASDEELGYVHTDDSFLKIIDDAADELAGRFQEARRSPAAHRVADLIDDLAARLTGERSDPPEPPKAPGHRAP